MSQKKLPLINSAHGSDTRNIINELIKLFNGMGYTYNEAIQKAQDVLNEAQQTNDMNESVQQQINTLIAESGTSDAEVVQARIDVEGNEYPVLKERLDESDVQLAQTTNELYERVDTIPLPTKTGMQTRSPKLVIKNGANDFSVLQRANKGYVYYKFDTADGDTSTTSVGGTWDLLRLKEATFASVVYLAKTQFNVTAGNMTTLYAPSIRNFLENELIYNNGAESTANFISSSGDGKGIGLYGISSTTEVSSVDFGSVLGMNRKMNVLIYGTPGSTKNADVLINGEVVKTFDASKSGIDGSNFYKILEFEVPIKFSSSKEINVTLRNNDITGKTLYFSCLNFVNLKDYDGESIDFYKVFMTSKRWINASGASDYAILNADTNKWCGSYHGGETRLSGKLTWMNPVDNTQLPRSWNYEITQELDIDSTALTDGMWTITPSFRIEQHTNINDEAKMVSFYDFDTDGTLQMDFSLYDNIIKSRQLYTALTATHYSFNDVVYPRFETLGEPLEHLYFDKTNEGMVVQRSTSNNLDLTIRYTKFGNRYNSEGEWIYNHETYYKKFYYGVVDGYSSGQGVVIPNLTFKKGLDFVVR